MSKIVVLVVEDEPIIRLNAVALIEGAGYEVAEAANADDAMRVLQASPEIDVVFSDIEMPGSMNGLQLIHAIRERWPPMGLILASGRVSPTIDAMPAETLFLRKPYTEASVLEAIRRADR